MSVNAVATARSREAVEAACRAAGVEIPPAQRHRVRTYKAVSTSRAHPCDRKLRRGPAPIHVTIDADIPQAGGIYFFWRGGTSFYVGQAVELQQRLTSHPMKKYCDEVAWVFCPQETLNFRESFYIGLLRPIGNFGTIKRIRCDQEQTYHFEERIGALVLTRSPTFRRLEELPLPPGAILKFPGSEDAR